MAQSLTSLSDRPRAAGWRADAADVLTTVMDAVRLRSRVFCRYELKAPWGMVLKRSDYAHFHVIERGGAWLRVSLSMHKTRSILLSPFQPDLRWHMH